MNHPRLALRFEKIVAVLLLAASITAILSAVSAQERGPSNESDATALITTTYEKTKEAKTVADYSEIIDLCNQAQKANVTTKQIDYLARLTSWALNRRGELVVKQAAELFEKGKIEEAAKLDSEALQDFQEAIGKDPTRWQPIHNRGVSYAQTGKIEEALADFIRVTELNSNYTKAWFNRGEAYYTLGQFEKAVASYDRALRLEPSDYAAHISRGHAHFQLQQYSEAMVDYDLAVQLNPDDGETLANRADAYQSLGMWQQAVNDYRRAISLDDRLLRAYQSAAWLLATCPEVRIRNTNLALRFAQKAMQLSEAADYRTFDTLAAAQASVGRYEEAKANLAKAMDLAPENVRETLEKRLELYEKGQPYRQGMLRASEPAENSRRAP